MTSALTAGEIADRLNLPRTRRGHRGTCPVCNNDALEVRAVHGRARVTCYYGCPPADLLRATGGEAVQPIQARPPTVSDADRTMAALRIWNGAADEHPALVAYCAHRGLPGLERSSALRWRSDVRHPEADGLHAAMVAVVQDVNGKGVAVHRTYTRRDGCGKADLSPSKASKGPVAGAAIRLDEAGPEMVIGEGIETSAAAGRLLGLPAWAAINAGNMERTMILPPIVRRVVIASDPDQAGQRGADGAARRWMAEGRDVRIIVPDGPGDFADVWASRIAQRG